jgi:hypothetical protein
MIIHLASAPPIEAEPARDGLWASRDSSGSGQSES